MARDFFDFVEQIRAGEKYFDVSREAIQRLLLAKHGQCDLLTDHDLEDKKGGTVTATLRLNITTRAESPLNWSMALKLHGVRIDGVDHESRFRMIDSGFGHGWHRHMWDSSEESAERDKLPITVLDGVSTRDQFLIRGLSVLKVRLNAVDHGQELLYA